MPPLQAGLLGPEGPAESHPLHCEGVPGGTSDPPEKFFRWHRPHDELTLQRCIRDISVRGDLRRLLRPLRSPKAALAAKTRSQRSHLTCNTFGEKRGRMPGTKDPPSPLDHALHDVIGFEHVVACVEIKNGACRRRRSVLIQNAGRCGCARGCCGGPWLNFR